MGCLFARRGKAANALPLSRALVTYVAFLAFATLAFADPITAITASHRDCMSMQDALKAESISWTSPVYFQFVAYWDRVAGCDPTTAISTNGLHTLVEDFDGAGGFRIELLLDQLAKEPCGRWQFDAHAYTVGSNGELDPSGLHSFVIDTGIDCEPVAPPAAPGGPPSVPPGPPSPVPEPATLWLLSTGIAAWYLTRRGQR